MLPASSIASASYGLRAFASFPSRFNPVERLATMNSIKTSG